MRLMRWTVRMTVRRMRMQTRKVMKMVASMVMMKRKMKKEKTQVTHPSHLHTLALTYAPSPPRAAGTPITAPRMKNPNSAIFSSLVRTKVFYVLSLLRLGTE